MTSREELRSSICEYLTYMRAKNAALTELSHASTSLLVMLRDDLPEGMDKLLKEREHICRRLMKQYKKDSWKRSGLIDDARKLAAQGNDELSQSAKELLELSIHAQKMGDDIIKSQKECEAIMKAQIDATACALRHSVQKRKLNAAYGPVSTQSLPSFLDRQR